MNEDRIAEIDAELGTLLTNRPDREPGLTVSEAVRLCQTCRYLLIEVKRLRGANEWRFQPEDFILVAKWVTEGGWRDGKIAREVATQCANARLFISREGLEE